MEDTFGTRVAAVTGANKGIGLAIVKALCSQFDGDVILTSRNVEKGKLAVNALNTVGLHPRYHQLDMNDEHSIHKMKKFLKKNYGGLDVLYNNAAISLDSNTVPFAEQAALTIGTNYFGTRRVCEALFPLLRPHARVVNLSSASGLLLQISAQSQAARALKKKLSSEDITTEELDRMMRNYVYAAKNGDVLPGWPDDPYAVSKIGVSALTKIQQREFDSDSREDLIVNAVHPGYVDTDMTKHLGYLSPEEGAEAPCWLGLLPSNVRAPKGCFVWHDQQIVDWVSGPVDSAF